MIIRSRGRGDIRASDVERDEVIAQLGTACGAGRLSTDELAERVGLVYQAVLRRELDELVADLPPRPTMSRLQRVADDFLVEASQLGFTRAELISLIVTRSAPFNHASGSDRRGDRPDEGRDAGCREVRHC